MPPLRGTDFTNLMSEAARKLGWHPFQAPAAVNSQEYGGRPGCAYHGNCDTAGCHISAKNSTAVTTIPRAVKTKNLTIFDRSTVTRILVGADGINSVVRAALFGEEAPVFAGCVAYRGLVPAERLADLGLEIGSQSWVGPGAHFVHYSVSRGGLLNFVGWTEHDEWNREDWTDRATVARALAAFEGWHPQVRRIISAADTCFIWALFDRDPLQQWSIGRATLLGDACHPMYPFMGQGAAQAIEDGAALAACLLAAGNADPATALRHYERLRLPRVTRLQDMSRANKTRFHMRDGPAQEARDAEWAKAADRSPDALRWLYDYDAGTVEPVLA